MARTNNLSNFLTDVADAIRSKTGSSEAIAAEDFDTEIENLPSGGGAIEEKDVNFYDYDGTLVNSYTKNEFLTLTEMPANPTHEGLTAQGWNWTLADAKDYVEENGILDVGQHYITDDGKTRIYIKLEEGRLSPYLGFAINGEAIIDWGDNTTDTVSGTSTTTTISTLHNYSSPGEYIITISSESNIYIVGDTSGETHLLWNNIVNSWKSNFVYQNSIYKIELSNNCYISDYAFYGCTSLKTISIPIHITAVKQMFYTCRSLVFAVLSNIPNIPYGSIFEGCSSLENVSLPLNGIISYHCFTSCRLLKRVVVPGGSTIAEYAFYGSGIKELIIPKEITSIGTYAIQSCVNLLKVTVTQGNTTLQLPNSCFDGCSVLNEVILNRITTLPASCFNNCGTLSKIIIPNTITSVGNSCFSNCYAFPGIKLPSTVSTINASAFSYCLSLGMADFSEHSAIPTLGSSAFSNIASDCKIIVPDDLYEDWIATENWSSLASYIISKSDWDALQNT